MPTFPVLKTGALAQFPFRSTRSFETRVLKFLDGTEQRISRRAEGRRWRIKLQNLDDAEWAVLRLFFENRQGRFEAFTFVDPTDGIAHASCYFEQDELAARFVAEGRTDVEIGIIEGEA